MSQETANNSTNLKNTFYKPEVITATDRRSQLLTWLSPLEPKLRHQDIQERRVDNVGEWLMQAKEFRSWRDWNDEGEGDSAVLFCYGDPGVGKTFLRYEDYSPGEKSVIRC